MKRFVETRHFSLPLFDSVNSSRASSTPSPLKAKISAAIRVFRKRDEDGGRGALPAEIKGRRERERERVSLKFPAHCRAFGVREWSVATIDPFVGRGGVEDGAGLMGYGGGDGDAATLTTLHHPSLRLTPTLFPRFLRHAHPPPLPFNLGLKAATISLLRFELRKEEEGGEGENWERRNFGKEDFEDKMLCWKVGRRGKCLEIKSNKMKE